MCVCLFARFAFAEQILENAAHGDGAETGREVLITFLHNVGLLLAGQQRQQHGEKEATRDDSRSPVVFHVMIKFTDVMFGLLARIISPALVTLGWILISLVAIFHFTTIYPAYFTKLDLLAISHLTIAAALIVNVYYNYYYCIRTSPGFAPIGVRESSLIKFHFCSPSFRWRNQISIAGYMGGSHAFVSNAIA